MGDTEKMEFTATVEASRVADYLNRISDGLRRGVLTLASGDRILRLEPTDQVKLELEAESKPEKGKGSLQLEVSWKSKMAVATERLEIAAGPLEIPEPEEQLTTPSVQG